MDGEVVIGTRLDSKELEKDLKNSKKELQKYEKETEQLTKAKAKAEVDLQPYREELQLLEKIHNEDLQKATTLEQQNFIMKESQSQLDSINQKYSKQIEVLDEINKKIKNNEMSQNLVKNKIEETTQKIEQIKGFDKIKRNINEIGNGLEETIKKTTKMALAVFGIRSAYNAVRSAMNTLSQYDEKMSANIEYIQYLLASTLEPVIKRIISLVNTLLAYVRYIVKAWTGKDIFNATKYFENMNKSSAGIAKNMKEATKQTTDFDEMNILGDNSSTSGNTETNITFPDLPDLEDVPIPEWLQWILDNKDIVIAALTGIAGGILAIKLGVEGFMALGIGLILSGIVLLIEGIIDFIKDPSWDNFATILTGLALILAGVAVAMLAVNAANPVAWIVLAIAAVVALVAAIIKYWDKIKEVLGKVGAWIYDHIIKPIVDFFVGLFESIKEKYITAWNFLTGLLSTVGTWIYEHIIKPVANFFVGLWDGVKNGVKGAFDFIKNIFNSVVSFFSSIISKIVGLFKTIGTKVGDAISGAFKTVINGVLSAIESILNFPIKSINKLIDTINKIPGINLNKLDTFSLPRMAAGGILNMPSSGVYRDGAIVGEGGPEGQVPLTNDRSLEIIGETIAKHVNINITNVTKLDNRQIAREQKKINAEQAFAYNS